MPSYNLINLPITNLNIRSYSTTENENLFHEQQLYEQLLQKHGILTIRIIYSYFLDMGIHKNDPRFTEVFLRLTQANTELVDVEQFMHIIAPAAQLVERVLNK
jgi:hypothetical protein